jgi:hypothetical protein
LRDEFAAIARDVMNDLSIGERDGDHHGYRKAEDRQ